MMLNPFKNMKIKNKKILKTMFQFKRNFSKGLGPNTKVFEGGIYISPFKNDLKAAACISADFELCWAFRGRSHAIRNSKGVTTRINFPYLINLFEKYNIPITWATIGHLFLTECDNSHSGFAHPDMPRPLKNNRWTEDWYYHDPCSHYKKDPLWYAPDLINQIINSYVNHEIGTHTFSHIDMTPDCSNEELVAREIEECIKVMYPFGLTPKTIVYPFNVMNHGYLSLLYEYGIIAVRNRDKKIRLSYPERTFSGIYKIYESMNTRSSQFYDYLDKAILFINEAIKRNAVYHLWFHPSDPTSIIQKEFRSIIEYIASERDKGILWVPTMAELAAYCEACDKTSIEIDRQEDELTLLIKNSMDYYKYGTPEISIVIPVQKLPNHIFMKNKGNSNFTVYENAIRTIENNKILLNISASTECIKIIF